jgi:hypothetical protein
MATGTAGSSLTNELNRLAGTTGLDEQGAANAWADTTGLATVGALNIKASSSRTRDKFKDINGICNELAGTTGLAAPCCPKEHQRMTTTLENMIDEVLINLAGYTFQQDRSTYLKTPVTTTTSSSASPLILSLGSTESVGKGIVEIDEELMWIDSYDRISNTATVAPQTGLPESTKDVAILGAAYRLLTYLDPARAAQVSPQADETDSKRPYGASQTATKQLYALYQQRLNEETKAQQQNYPPRVHFSRR